MTAPASGKAIPLRPPPRQLPDLVGDLDKLLDAAEIPGPYVLVGASGGLVFATESGTLINPSNLRNRSFKPLLEHARLPDHLLS